MNSKEHSILHAGRDYYFEATIRVAALMAMVIHTALTAYFFIIDVLEMGYYNAASSLFFLSFFLLMRKGWKITVIFFAVGSLEVILHALLATYFVGSESGFGLFMWVIPTVLVVHRRVSLTLVLIVVSVIGSVFVCGQELNIFKNGVYSIGRDLEVVSYYVSLVSLLSTGLAVNLNFRLIVRQKEQIILREIHHRIKNNLQIVSSIASIRNYTSENRETNKLVENLKSDVHYLSSLHSQVKVTPDGMLLDFAAFMSNTRNQLMQHSNLQVHEGLEAEAMLDIDFGIPLGLMASQVLEGFADISRHLEAECLVRIELNAWDDRLDLKMLLLSPSIDDTSVDLFPEPRLEIVDILADQNEGTFSLTVEQKNLIFDFSTSLNIAA